MPTIAAAELERLARDVFTAHGVPDGDAAWIAAMLVRANLRGHDSHGVIRIPQYAASLKAGTLNPRPQLTLVVDTPTIAILDGDGGFGQVVARRGVALAIERARAQGLAAVALRGANHVGRLADYAELAAREGLVGLLWVNARGGLNVAPWGGAARRLGTNPHAIGIPGPGGSVAMSHDFATSVWAEGKLRVKFNRGERVPPGIMLDGRGGPSTDPREYYSEPPGSLLTAGAHKGFGLSVAVEILAGILSGAGAASGEKSVFRNGTLIVCVDPARFMPLPEFHAQVAALLEWVRSAPLAAGATEILIPGEPEARMERERRAAGVPIEDETWRQIRQVAEEVGAGA
ncbi:MAG TPA: Ldh family oxidoreductase [Methylomirabilota bacterium]|nr:Ldh family oxidoreductase [Methylomirabilota bacterium]